MNAFTTPDGPRMQPAGDADLAALFDGWCGVCTRSAIWVGERDPAGRVERLDMRDDAAAARFPAIDAEAARAQLHVVDRDGRVYVGIDALARLLRAIPGWGPVGALIGVPGVHAVTGVAYRWFASRRLSFNRWFPLADKSCDDACSHPPVPDRPATTATTTTTTAPPPKFADGRGLLK